MGDAADDALDRVIDEMCMGDAEGDYGWGDEDDYPARRLSKSRHTRKKLPNPCQEVTRTNKTTGVQFRGCSNYPECRWSRPIEESKK